MAAKMFPFRMWRDVNTTMAPRFEVKTMLGRLSKFKSMMIEEEMVPRVHKMKTTIMVYLIDGMQCPRMHKVLQLRTVHKLEI